MNVTLRQSRAFVAVACTGSVTLAAENLFITQSALSGLIRNLEQALGYLADSRWVNLLAYPLISLQGQLTERLAMDLRASMRGLEPALRPAPLWRRLYSYAQLAAGTACASVVAGRRHLS